MPLWEDSARLQWGRCTIRRCWPWVSLFAASFAAASPAQRHPIPEYAPVKGLLVSEDLFNYPYGAEGLANAVAGAGADLLIATDQPRAAASVRAQLAAAGVKPEALARVRVMHLPHGNIWMRDYGPLPVREADGRLTFLDFRYLDPASRANDEFPKVAGKALGVPVESVPVELDGGNFLTNGDFCFTSATDLRISKESSPAKALAKYGKQLGCRQTIVIADPPHAHLDMWAKIVDDQTVLVNELDARTLARITEIYGQVPPDLTELRDSLNHKAAELARYLHVVRVPMPMPYRGSFRTFTNAALVNGHAVVPSFKRFGWNRDDYPDANLEPYYEEQAAAAYRAAGYSVTFVGADGLVFNGGAWRCVTAPLPQPAA